MSSGLLGIGGGLAITVLGGAILKLRQHQAQALSLATTALPLTLPAAWSYVHKGTPVPPLAIAGIVAGLWVGTIVGSRIANWLSAKTLRYTLVALVAAMAEAPQTVPQILVDWTLKLTGAQSAGISVLESDGAVFRWRATAGCNSRSVSSSRSCRRRPTCC